MVAADEERAVLQRDAQQRQLQATDQRGAGCIGADLLLDLPVQHRQQLEGVVVLLRQRRALAALLPCLRQQRLPDVVQAVARVRREWPVLQRAQRLEHVLGAQFRSEEHTSELQSLMRITYAVFCSQK